MKKILLALLASTAVGGVVAAQSFPDVPSDSYAADAVSRLADLGIVIGFPDGTFRGNEAFTRYQAALVVSRLLDTVQGEMLTSADLDTLRNAVQELASDVAANQQSVQDLQTAINSSQGADPAAVEQLQSQLDALTVQLDTLNAAQSAAAGLEQQVQSNTDQISQLNDLVGILNDDIQGANSGQTDTSFLADITQNTSDIANLREFVVLLRRNQAGLTERVATIEESDTAQNGRLDDVETRVTALEQAGLTFSGSIGLRYDVSRLSGASVPFDVDRIFGFGLKREQPASIFSGEFSTATDSLTDDTDQLDPGEVARDRQDIEFSTGTFSPLLTLNFNFSQSRGISAASGLNSFDGSVDLKLRRATLLKGETDVTVPGATTTADNYFDGYAFEFTALTATLGPIGADPINFYFGKYPGAMFTDYVFESLGPGFRLEIGTPDFLAFLQPTLTFAYGVFNNGGDVADDTLELPNNGKDILAVDGAPVANPFTDAYYRGIHGTLTPFSGEGFSATGGFSVAQLSGNAADNADAATALDPRYPGVGPNADITVYGLNGDVNLSVLNVTFEYATNTISDGVYFQTANKYLQDTATPKNYVDFAGNIVPSDDRIPIAVDGAQYSGSNLFYSELTVDTEAAGIPFLRELTANYRDIPKYWYGLRYDKDTYPWKTDQKGYGASATVGLSIFNLTGFYDSYSIAEPVNEALFGSTGTVTGTNVDAYGVELGATVYRAIEVFGFYNFVYLNGQQVQILENADRNNVYVAGLGVGVRHDGQAEDALVPGVDFDIEYSITNNEISAANLNAEGTIAGITLTPYITQKIDSTNLPFSDDVNSTEAGTGISTTPLDVLLQPSFAANINYRNAVHSDVSADVPDYVANVIQYSVGVNFNQFLLENSSLGVRYGSFAGTNIQNNPNVNGSGDFASDISDGDSYNAGTVQVTSGYEVVYNYYGLEFGYGAYVSDTNGPAAGGATGGQAFSILYTVNF